MGEVRQFREPELAPVIPIHSGIDPKYLVPQPRGELLPGDKPKQLVTRILDLGRAVMGMPRLSSRQDFEPGAASLNRSSTAQSGHR